MNIHGTEAGSLTVVLPKDIRRGLFVQRLKYGAHSAIGRRLSNLIEQFKHLPNAEGEHRARLREKMLQQVDGIERLMKPEDVK